MRVMLLEVAQVTEAAVRSVVGELTAKLVAGEVPVQSAILGECLEVYVPSAVGKRAYLVVLFRIYAEKERMAVLVRIDDLRIMRVDPAASHDLGGDHALIGRAPPLHQAEGTHGGLGDHPVMDTGIGLVRP
ncbi:hypothetical protein D9M69_470550 [compost metagenome]